MGTAHAHAQNNGQIEVASVGDNSSKLAVIDRIVYAQATNQGPVIAAWGMDPVPGSSPVLAVGASEVVLANGEIWTHEGYSWARIGVFPLGLPVNVEPHTLGQLKQRFRSGAAPAGR